MTKMADSILNSWTEALDRSDLPSPSFITPRDLSGMTVYDIDLHQLIAHMEVLIDKMNEVFLDHD